MCGIISEGKVLSGWEVRLNTHTESPDKAKPSARRGRKVTNLHGEKMAELPKDTGIERSAFFSFPSERASEEQGAAKAESEMKNARGAATLIFDGSCPVCAGTVKWIHENELEGSFEMLPCQAASAGGQFPGIQRSECMKAMHLVLPDGTVLAGEKALPEIFTRLKAYRVFAPLFKIPGAGALSRIAYRWFADRRYRVAAFLSHLRSGGKPVQ